MSNNSGYMPELLAMEAKFNLQQLQFSSKVGKAFEKTNALQSEASSEMATKASAAGAKADKYAGNSAWIGGAGAIVAALGAVLTGVSLLVAPEAILGEASAADTGPKQAMRHLLKNAGSYGGIMSMASRQGTKLYTGITNYDMAKDKAGIALESALATQTGGATRELTNMMSSATKLQASLVRSMADVISSYKQAEIV